MGQMTKSTKDSILTSVCGSERVKCQAGKCRSALSSRVKQLLKSHFLINNVCFPMQRV